MPRFPGEAGRSNTTTRGTSRGRSDPSVAGYRGLRDGDQFRRGWWSSRPARPSVRRLTPICSAGRVSSRSRAQSDSGGPSMRCSSDSSGQSVFERQGDRTDALDQEAPASVAFGAVGEVGLPLLETGVAGGHQQGRGRTVASGRCRLIVLPVFGSRRGCGSWCPRGRGRCRRPSGCAVSRRNHDRCLRT